MLDGTVSPGVALSVLNAFERIRARLADPQSAPLVMHSLLDAAQRDGARALNTGVTGLLETYGTADAVQDDQAAAR